MLKISERVSPCSARWFGRSVGRLTTTLPSSCSTVMSRGMRSESSPLGPCTRTSPEAMSTVTPLGTAMGCLPMRDMRDLPDLRHDLAADALLARVVTGHDAARRREDRRAHATLDL